MGVIKRYMITKNGKGIGFEDSEKGAFEVIGRDLNVKKDCEYIINDLKDDVYIDTCMYVCDKKRISRLTKKKQKAVKVKRNDIVDDKYSKWLGKQPCVITGQVANRGAGPHDMHCHHVYGRGKGRNDYMQVPLIGHVHSWGGNSYHSCANSDFIKHHNLMVTDVVEYFEDHARRLKDEYDGNA